jgi:cellulose biosynthesis protein BcsQ
MLEHVKDEFDIILIDKPPSMSYATFTALYASTSLIVPVAPTENDWDATLNWVTQLPAIFDALSLHGFEGFEDEIRFLLTNHDGKNTAIEITRKIGETFPGAVLGTSLNQNEAVRVCAQNLCTIFDVSKSEYFKSYKKPFDLSVNNAEAVTADIMNRILANWARQEKEHV